MHSLELSCKIDISQAQGDISTYKSPTNCDLLLNNSLLELIHFDSNTKKKDKKLNFPFRFSQPVRHCKKNPANILTVMQTITVHVLFRFIMRKNEITPSKVSGSAVAQW